MNIEKEITDKVIARFSKFYSNFNDGSCWEWNGCKNSDGYGEFRLSGLNVKAHRMSYMISKGQIKHGMHVLHVCDNPPCVNPDHLFVGTNKDNVMDKMSKNRQPKGEEMARSKLKNHDIPRIKMLSKLGMVQTDIANIFHVSQVCVSHIISKKRWSHI